MNNFLFAYKKRNSIPAGCPINGTPASTVLKQTSTGSINQGNAGNNSNETVELHTNIWKVSDGGINPKTQIYFDFGLKFQRDIEQIRVYIPFDIEDNTAKYDLVEMLQNNNKLLCTIFNEDLKSNIDPNSTFVPVTTSDTSDQKKFFLHKLGALKFKKSNICIGQNKKQKLLGTFIDIDIDNIPETLSPETNEYIYIRFRIQPKNIEDVSRSEYISNDLLQAAFSKMDMFDIRINETRDLNSEVIDDIKSKNFKIFKLDTVHLFFMAQSNEKIENGSSLKSDSRLLESFLWSDYLPGKAPRHCYIAHHWKKREKKTNMKIIKAEIISKISYEPFLDYRIFFTSVYPKIQWGRLFTYIFVVVLFGWCGSMLTINTSLINDSSNSSLIELIKISIVLFMLVTIILFAILKNYRFTFKIRSK